MNRFLKKAVMSLLAMTFAFASVSAMALAEGEGSSVTTYSGNEVTPVVMAVDGGTKLVNGVDYDLTYENNVNVGTATVIVTFKGNYTGERRVNFEIVPMSVAKDDGKTQVSTVADQVYTGVEICPEPTITVNGTTLVKDTDFEFTYSNNTNVGEANIHVAMKGNYTGTMDIPFNITPDIIDEGQLNIASVSNQVYVAGDIKPEPAVTYKGRTLVKDRDYTISYADNRNVGTATMTFDFKGNYSGQKSEYFEIVTYAIQESDITVDTTNKTFTGSNIEPSVSLSYLGNPLVKDTEYTVEYTSNLNVGTATITVKGVGNFSGEHVFNFVIEAKQVTEQNVTISDIPDQTFTGDEIKPEPDVYIQLP